MNRSLGLIVAIVLLIVVIAGVFLLRGNQNPTTETPASTEQTTETEVDDIQATEDDAASDSAANVSAANDAETVSSTVSITTTEELSAAAPLSTTESLTSTAPVTESTVLSAAVNVSDTGTLTTTGPITTADVVTAADLLTATTASTETTTTQSESTEPIAVTNAAAISGSGLAGEEYAVVDIDPTLLDGETLFIDNCAKCHGLKGYGDGPSMGSLGTLTGNMSLAILDAKSDEEILDAITNGRGVEMPPWGLVMSLEQREAVLAYVRTLSLSNQ